MGILPQRRTYRKSRFMVRRPIRGFRDLEVYQRAKKCASDIMTKVIPALAGSDCPVRNKLVESCLRIPELIASAHSRRFEKGDEEKIMDNCLEECNKTMVYLEQAGDIFADKLDRAVCDDLVKRYIYTRRKIRNLQKAWAGFGLSSFPRKRESISKSSDIAGK